MSEGFMDKLKSIYSKVKDIVARAFTAIRDWLVSSALNFAEFLGLTPDIKFNNTVKW